MRLKTETADSDLEIIRKRIQVCDYSMKFKVDASNKGAQVLNDKFESELEDIRTALERTDYHVKKCNQKDRENETIFDPIGTNAAIKNELVNLGWDAGVGFVDPGYSSGKDIDFWKNGVGVEVQFSHYTSLDSDMNRLERLYEDVLELKGNREVKAGVVVVVSQDMPTSQSVAHFQQAVERAAKSISSIPTFMFGIQPPKQGEDVFYCTYPKPRSRTLEEKHKIEYTGYVPEDDTE